MATRTQQGLKRGGLPSFSVVSLYGWLFFLVPFVCSSARWGMIALRAEKQALCFRLSCIEEKEAGVR